MISSDTVSIYTGTSGFKLVTSGSECQRIHNKDLCKKAIKMLNVNKICDGRKVCDFWPQVSNYGTSRPPGCFMNNDRQSNFPIWLNTDASSSTECSVQYPCVCLDCPKSNTSGTCQRATSRDECETFASQIGLGDTTAHVGYWNDTKKYPPYCFYRHDKSFLYFNTYQHGNNNPCTDWTKCVCQNGLLPSGLNPSGKIQQDKKCCFCSKAGN